LKFDLRDNNWGVKNTINEQINEITKMRTHITLCFFFRITKDGLASNKIMATDTNVKMVNPKDEPNTCVIKGCFNKLFGTTFSSEFWKTSANLSIYALG